VCRCPEILKIHRPTTISVAHIHAAVDRPITIEYVAILGSIGHSLRFKKPITHIVIGKGKEMRLNTFKIITT
jgi:hypothetical protein